MNSRQGGASPPGDRASSSVSVSSVRPIGHGYRSYERFSLSRPDREGVMRDFDRDVLRSGAVVGILPVDPGSGEVVLTRQFRIGGHLATGRGEMVEIAAGRVDAGETIEQAARRECLEETGLTPLRLTQLLEFAPAPALSDEFMTLFLAQVEATRAPAWAGAAHEDEEIEVVRYPIGAAIGLMENGAIQSGPTIIALQWLTGHKDLLQSILSG